jgi:ribosome-binding protein aMBF1 (putative translation factor)
MASELNQALKDSLQQFAAKIRAGRAVLGWSQTELGKRIGITQRAIYRIEDGATVPRQLTRLRIEKAFNDAGIEFVSAPSGGFTMRVRSPDAGPIPDRRKQSRAHEAVR